MTKKRDPYNLFLTVIYFLPIFCSLSKSPALFGMDVGDTLTINPIYFKTPSPEGWNAPYKTIAHFPQPGELWSKIIMVQTLKCDSLTKGDKYPCGEWDYIWNTFVKVPGVTQQRHSVSAVLLRLMENDSLLAEKRDGNGPTI